MKIEQLKDIVEGTLIHRGKKRIRNYSIDTRTLEKNDVYFAIEGKSLDGHLYVLDAIIKGASTIVVSKVEEEWKNKNVHIILVDDTTLALIRLASYIRKQYPIPLIAITGSVGKTTTKDLIYEVLSTKYKVLKSPKNYNNRIGVPLTLFQLDKSYDMIVMELGMNHLKEIQELSLLCRPDVAVITNIGTAHIGYLGGQENIRKAKLEILEGMNRGTLLVNGLDKMLQRVISDNTVIRYIGKEEVQIRNVQFYPKYTIAMIQIQDEVYTLKYYLPGDKMVMNILMAIQIGLLFEIPIASILASITKYRPKEKRLHRIQLNQQLELIDDSYNASLESLENDLTILNVTTGDKYLILGDFLELGKYSKEIHKKAIHKVRKVKKMKVFLVGDETYRYRRHIFHAHAFRKVEDLISYLKLNPIKKGTILVKGSRKVGLDQVVEILKKDLK